MAATVVKLDFSTMHSVLGAVLIELSRVDQLDLIWAGQQCEIYSMVVDASATSDVNITTKLARVLRGAAFNVSDGVWMANTVRPLSTNAAVAVVGGSLTVSKTYIVIVSGAETLQR